MINSSLIRPDLIFIDLCVNDQDEALIQLSHALVKQGFVKESYPAALLEREQNFPTGLGAIAIPHTDREHTLQDAIAIATLKEPVTFKMMGSDTECCSVSVIFMLAISTNDQQIDMLQTLIGFVQDDSKLQALKACTNQNQVYALLTQ